MKRQFRRARAHQLRLALTAMMACEGACEPQPRALACAQRTTAAPVWMSTLSNADAKLGLWPSSLFARTCIQTQLLGQENMHGGLACRSLRNIRGPVPFRI